VLEGVKRRDREALGRFFDHYFDHVYRLVHRLLGERAAAEDVTQEVFFKVHRAAHLLDTTRDPAPWLTTIATNACRDVWRSSAHRMARRSESVDEAGLAERLTARTDEPERGVLASERERLVRQAISELPEHLREAVLLYDYQGLSHLQIAEVLGIHHAAARKRYSRALEALGKRLRETLGP
jgi:RNA polymerase sigma-70 factor (ECF subfamily)